MRRSTPEIETTDGHIADRKTGVELCRCVAGRWVVLLRVVEQLTLLLFLKMADHLTEEPYDKPAVVPPALGWKALFCRSTALRWRTNMARSLKHSASNPACSALSSRARAEKSTTRPCSNSLS